MVVKRQIMFCGDSEQADYPNAFGSHRNACLAELRRLGYAMDCVGPYDDGAGAGLGRLHRGVLGEQSATVAAALATFGTELTTYLTGTIGTRARPVVVCNWGVNDIGAASRSAAQVYASNAAISAQVFVSVPDVILVWRNIIKPGAGATGGYGSNGAIFDTYRSGFATQAALWGATVSEPGTSIELRVDQIHPTDSLAGYGAVGLADAAAIVGVL